MATRLDLPPSPRTLVFRRIVLQLRNDPVLRRTLKTVLAWEGGPNEARDLVVANAPGIRLTPSCGPDMWAFPDAQRGWLFINVDMLVPGTDVGDTLDLWHAIIRALYPRDFAAQLAFQKELRDLGVPYCMGAAYTGMIEFSQPAAADGAPDQHQECIAQMKVEILLDLN